MRRPGWIMSVALTGLAAVPAPAAAPSPTATPSSTPTGTAICTVTDPRAEELSGLVATTSGYAAINDSNDDPTRIKIFYLDRNCRVTRTLSYPTAARDPEDLAQAPDATLWVSDTGDNLTSQSHRTTIALWHVPANGSAPVIYRLTYPDGPHDAEALFFTPSGTPVIVTKELLGTSFIYEPAQPLRPGTAKGVPLKRVGQFSPTATGVPNPLGLLGEVLVTGAATSPDRKRVALRTYAAAYEWDVPDGDPVKAITSGTPRVTPLPDEPQGESIAYTVDGSALLTLSDQAGPTTLLRYTPTAPAGPAGSPATVSPTDQSAIVRAIEKVPGWAMLAIATGGLGLVVIGSIGLLRARRRGRPPTTSRHRA